jgi:quinol monooxygenase YgiN
MYIIIAPIQIKEGFKDQYIKGIKENASGAVNDEPGCSRFDVVQDATDENRIWVYEVYDDEAAFQAHTQAPHFLKFRDLSSEWRAEGTLQGAGRGATNIWPSDGDWAK